MGSTRSKIKGENWNKMLQMVKLEILAKKIDKRLIGKIISGTKCDWEKPIHSSERGYQ